MDSKERRDDAIVEREASKNIEENEKECFIDGTISSRSQKRFVGSLIHKYTNREIVGCIVAASFHISVGLSFTYSATLIAHLEREKTGLHASREETSWITSLIAVSIPIGALLAGMLMERFGRLRTLQIGSIPSVTGWIFIALATNVPMLLVGRLLAGLATALVTSPAIVYITEVARPELRGSMISVTSTLTALGTLLAYLKGAYLHWRLVAWISIIYEVVPVILVQLFVPESPLWLISKGRIEDARKSLERLYKNETAQDVTSIAESKFTAIMEEYEIKLSEQRRSKHGNVSNKLRYFLKPTGWKPMAILFLLFSFQQFSGVYTTLLYAVIWFQEVGANVDEYIASIMVGVTHLSFSMVNVWLLRRYKRRSLCIVSSLGMAVCMIISGYFTLNIKNGDRSGYWIPMFCLLLYMAAALVGIMIIPWTMSAELFPTEIRGIANCICYFMAHLLMFAALQSYRSLQTFLGGSYAVQWFFAGVSLGSAVFVWLLLPETYGKKLSEIEMYFQNNFLALGADTKEKKRRARTQQSAKSLVVTF